MKIVNHRFSNIYSHDRSVLNEKLFEENGFFEKGIKEFFSQFPVVPSLGIFGSIPPRSDIEDPSLGTVSYTSTKNIKIFETEQEAFLWYKKSSLRSSYSNVEEKDFVKNYFTINSNNIGKYYKYLNGMKKSFKIDLNFDVNFSRDDPADCGDGDEEESSSSSSSTPPGSLGIFTFEDFEEVFSYLDNGSYKILQDNSEDLKGKINANIQCYFNSFDIFKQKELEQRLSSLNVKRDIVANTFLEEGSPSQKYNTLFVNGRQIYKDDWKFSQENFLDFFEKNEKFPYNSTLVNDPIIENVAFSAQFVRFFDSAEVNLSKGVSSDLISKFYSDGPKNEYFYSTDKFGYYSLNVSKSSTETLNDIGCRIELRIEDIVYIKSQNKYLCFITLVIRLDFNISRREIDSTFYLYTTNELQANLKDEDEKKRGKKNNFQIFLDKKDNPINLELYKLPNNYEYEIPCGENKKGKRNINIIENNLNIQIDTWQNKDFGTVNFPPRKK